MKNERVNHLVDSLKGMTGIPYLYADYSRVYGGWRLECLINHCSHSSPFKPGVI